MAFEVKTTPDFERSVKKILKKYNSFNKDILHLVDELESNPTLGTDLGNNLFKIRLSVTGLNKGKSGEQG